MISDFESIEVSDGKKPKVAIFGDLYVRDNDVMNQDLIHFIEAHGGEVIVTPYSAYVQMIAEAYLKKWFLEGKDDVRSSYYLEDVATEFHVQGLELDWVCVSWDGDFRYSENGWQHFSFRGSKWQHIRKERRRVYLKNAYRVLLTRARQGMVIFVPRGTSTDPTRDPSFYDSTFKYLRMVGLPEL